ncbi:bifunctional DNA primase/polymerase [Saccharibacillus sp. CPCC 101409]|uniref:bifunctional DNA primase/polymerase n=1 Tax=Saccharibacillus sp. CPCC 101409 TaxID=3058041 RepID=UPI0026717716|nr:bifunctional DNA primase/polymerase [Saccharibacillus sp. CPCC 101409]MDO3409705.1 bifunctional DNA primase/polymerase [Saccharibacillus sp. CPCC 101409]
MLTEALRYTQLLFPIIPLCSHNHSHMSEAHVLHCKSPGKRPLIKNWQNAGVPSEQQVKEWFKRWPTANIGLVLGRSAGLVALDVDGEFGQSMLTELSGNDLPATWQFTTPGGGMRYVFSLPQNTACPKFTYRDPDSTHTHSELAILGDGSCTVLPPSIHKNGGIYTWINSPE